ncbi:DEAD/DEAH box helicase [Methanothermococcus sp. SCGC AD-155-K20]|nr:DEAD/DEAH box helicase [Methanothermococcus sp. SCGC AD-155-K20]
MYVNHPLIKPNTMESRLYQQVIVANALKKNTLCVLGTGLGKTAVATLTIAGILSKRDGKVLIIAPSRPLVEQHYNSLKTFLNIDGEDIVILTGKISPEKRKKLWKDGKIFIATPQVVENDIVAGRISPEEFVLLIADEAHHTTGSHSYTFVASAFKDKTRVLGLTASPGSNIDRILEVCENLGIEHVEIKTYDDADVRKYIKNVKIKPLKVKLPNEYVECINLLKKSLKERLKILRDSGVIYTTNINKSELLALQRKIMMINDNSRYELMKIVSEAIKLDYAIETLECQGKDAFLNYYERLGSQNTKSAKGVVGDSRVLKVVYKLRTMEMEHPKMEKLVELIKTILSNSKDKGEKIIVFAQYRDTVDKIVNILNSNDINALPFVGQSNKDGKGMSQKKQVEVIERFKNDDNVNVLVSTSVSEEGIDIMSVNYVIFYEPVPSEVRYIQRRGRAARGEGGECIILIAKDSRDEGYYWSAIQKERNMRRLLKEMEKTLNEKLKERNYEGNINEITTDVMDNGNTINKKQGPLDVYINMKNDIKSKDNGEGINKGENKDNKKIEEKINNNNEHGKNKKPKIIVDHREKIIGRYLYNRVELEFKNLDIGDYILSDRVVVERKTSEDFEDSIIDKRLFRQLRELKKYERPILIIEGDKYIRLSEKVIKGAIISIILDYNIPVMFSNNIEETVDILLKLSEREQLQKKRTVEIRTGKKPMSLRERQRFIVESFPDIGPITAENLLIKFNTVKNIVNAPEEKLMEVEGIGKITAKKIKEVLSEKYEK